LDCEERTIWIADAHRGDGKRFVVRADEKLTAFGTGSGDQKQVMNRQLLILVDHVRDIVMLHKR
jgi:hypothetical protein